MNKKVLITAIIMVIGAMIVYDGLNQEVNSSSTGAAPGYAGDPAFGGLTCALSTCHSGPAPTVDTGIITTNVPAAGYKPDTTYSISATVTRGGHVKFGFEITAENTSGTNMGTLINMNSNTQLTSYQSHYYITHTSAGNHGTTGFHTWTFNWKAPAAGSGPVTFYGCFNITNNNGFDTGDTIVRSTTIIQENTLHAGMQFISSNENAISIFPNPCVENTTITIPANISIQSPVLHVYDIAGKEISVPFIVNNSSTTVNNLILNTSSLATGIYFCRVSDSGAIIFSGKLMVSK
jgi:hypothetical protein